MHYDKISIQLKCRILSAYLGAKGLLQLFDVQYFLGRQF